MLACASPVGPDSDEWDELQVTERHLELVVRPTAHAGLPSKSSHLEVSQLSLKYSSARTTQAVSAPLASRRVLSVALGSTVPATTVLRATILSTHARTAVVVEPGDPLTAVALL